MAIMAAHSVMEIGRHLGLACRESYVPDLAALFTEAELQDEDEQYGYISDVGELRERLQLQGFTSGRALEELEATVRVWHGEHDHPDAKDPGVPVRDASVLLDELRAFANDRRVGTV